MRKIVDGILLFLMRFGPKKLREKLINMAVEFGKENGLGDPRVPQVPYVGYKEVKTLEDAAGLDYVYLTVCAAWRVDEPIPQDIYTSTDKLFEALEQNRKVVWSDMFFLDRVVQDDGSVLEVIQEHGKFDAEKSVFSALGYFCYRVNKKVLELSKQDAYILKKAVLFGMDKGKSNIKYSQICSYLEMILTNGEFEPVPSDAEFIRVLFDPRSFTRTHE